MPEPAPVTTAPLPATRPLIRDQSRARDE
jgi:hypothetical protein